MEASGQDVSFKPNSKALGVCFAMFVVGMICFGVGLGNNPADAWSHWLIGAFYTTALALFGVFFIAMNYAVGAGWNVVIRRVNEAMASYLIFGFIAMIALFVGINSMQHESGMEKLYEWLHIGHGHGGHGAEHAGAAVDQLHAAHAHGAAGHVHDAGHEAKLHAMHSKLLEHKASYLNRDFFGVRMVCYFLIWIFFGWKLISNSRKQDMDGSVNRTKSNVRWSCFFIVAFSVTLCLASFDWIMSLEPTWFSTIFGVYNFAGLFASGLAATIVLLFLVRKMGYLKEVNANHFHNLGMWLIAVTVFWAYIWFSQFLLIWYSNIPEETQHYIFRMDNPEWNNWLYLNLIWNFAIPFLALLQQPVKRNEKLLTLIAVWILIGRWIDLFWGVGPIAQVRDGHTYGFDISIAAGTTIGFLGLFGFVFFKALGRAPLLAKKDPYFEESVHHHSA